MAITNRSLLLEIAEQRVERRQRGGADDDEIGGVLPAIGMNLALSKGHEPARDRYASDQHPLDPEERFGRFGRSSNEHMARVQSPKKSIEDGAAQPLPHVGTWQREASATGDSLAPSGPDRLIELGAGGIGNRMKDIAAIRPDKTEPTPVSVS